MARLRPNQEIEQEVPEVAALFPARELVDAVFARVRPELARPKGLLVPGAPTYTMMSAEERKAHPEYVDFIDLAARHERRADRLTHATDELVNAVRSATLHRLQSELELRTYRRWSSSDPSAVVGWTGGQYAVYTFDEIVTLRRAPLLEWQAAASISAWLLLIAALHDEGVTVDGSPGLPDDAEGSYELLGRYFLLESLSSRPHPRRRGMTTPLDREDVEDIAEWFMDHLEAEKTYVGAASSYLAAASDYLTDVELLMEQAEETEKEFGRWGPWGAARVAELHPIQAYELAEMIEARVLDEIM